MDKKITFSADASQIVREVNKLNQELSKATKPQKIKFEIDDRKFKEAAKFHKETYKNIQNDIKNTIMKMSGDNVTDKQHSILSRRLKETRADLSRQASLLRGMGVKPGEEEAAGGGGGGGGAASLLSLGARYSPYAMAAYAGYKILGYGTAAYGKAHNLQGYYAKLRSQGFGKSRAMGMIAEGTGRGVSADESRSLMSGLVGATGTMDPNLFRQVQTFSKAYGVDQGLLTGITGTLRQTGSSGQDLVRKNADILSTAIAAKLDRGRLSEYLQATASAIEKMSGDTAGLNSTPIAQLMGMLTKGGGAMTPGLAGSNLAAMDNLIKNPSAAQSPLVFNAMAQTLAQGGYKGNMALAIQTLQTTGLGKPDLNAKQFPALAASGGLGQFQDIYNSFDSMGFVKNIAKNINQASGTMGPVFAANLGTKYGIKGGAPGVAEFLAKVGSPGFNKAEADKMMENFMPQAEVELKDLNKSIEGTTAAIDAQLDWQKENIGDKLLEPINEIRKTLYDIAQKLMPILDAIAPILKVGVGVAKYTTPLGLLGAGQDMIKSAGNYGVNLRKKLSIPMHVASGGGGAGPIMDEKGILANAWEHSLWGQKSKYAQVAPGGTGLLGNQTYGSLLAKAGKSLSKLVMGTAQANSGLKFKTKVAENSFASYKDTSPALYDAVMNLPMGATITEAHREKSAKHGARDSQHHHDNALDFSVAGMSDEQIQALIDALNKKKGVKAAFHPKGYYGATADHVHAQGSGAAKVYMPHELTSTPY